jgi:transcriptional regulator with XRE-family HTH domain
MIRRRGLRRSDIAREMKITTVTLAKYLNEPYQMRGDHRNLMATALGVGVEVIDTLINGRINYDREVVDTLLETIQPLKTKANA